MSDRDPGLRTSSRYLPELEALRGVAITLVFLYHASVFIDGSRGHRLGIWVSSPTVFMHAGYTGVSLFFVLSAFLLSLPFIEEAIGGRAVDRRRYFSRRALRILPLYWTVVLVCTLVLASKPWQLLHGGPYLLFLNSLPWFSVTLVPLNSPWWSLATEVQFYVLLPLLPWCCCSRRRTVSIFVGLAIAYAVIVEVLATRCELGIRFAIYHSVFGRMPLFLAGIVAAWLYRSRGQRIEAWLGRGRAMRAGVGDGLFIAVLVLLGLLLRWLVFVGYWEAELLHPAWHVLEGSGWAVVILLLVLFPLRLRGLIVNRCFETVGRWSFSIYLVHVPLLYLFLPLLPFQAAGQFTGWHAGDFFILGVLTVSTLVLSAITYRFIERPFLVHKARLAL